MTHYKEETFTLPAPDGKIIYGILTRAEKATNKVVILAHGLTGHMLEHIHIEAKEFFVKQGYDVVRFNFYDEQENARLLHETTLEIHASDLNTICDHFRPLYQKLYCAGHSYGGLTLLIANPEANAFCFWDSSFTPYATFWKDEGHKLEGTPYYTIGWRSNCLVGQAMYEEGKTMDSRASGYAKKIRTPSLVILAGDSIENVSRTALYNALTCEKKLVDIEGADHSFTTNDTLDSLLGNTLDWFEAH